MSKTREPLLNVPGVITGLIAAFCLVHVARTFLLPGDADIEFLLEFAFIPARYDPSLLPGGEFPGGMAAEIWTFVTYAFIHGDITHLAVNSVWLLPFGSAVARRFGTLRFLVFFVVAAAVGAAVHLATHAQELLPMVGASGAISGCMAAAVRFVFQPGAPLGGPFGIFRTTDNAPYRVPAMPLTRAFRDTRILAFLAVWFGLNLVFGVGSITFSGVEQSVAWETHIGGFLVGLLLFAFFDPVPRQAVEDAVPADPDDNEPGSAPH